MIALISPEILQAVAVKELIYESSLPLFPPPPLFFLVGPCTVQPTFVVRDGVPVTRFLRPS